MFKELSGMHLNGVQRILVARSIKALNDTCFGVSDKKSDTKDKNKMNMPRTYAVPDLMCLHPAGLTD